MTRRWAARVCDGGCTTAQTLRQQLAEAHEQLVAVASRAAADEVDAYRREYERAFCEGRERAEREHSTIHAVEAAQRRHLEARIAELEGELALERARKETSP